MAGAEGTAISSNPLLAAIAGDSRWTQQITYAFAAAGETVDKGGYVGGSDLTRAWTAEERDGFREVAARIMAVADLSLVEVATTGAALVDLQMVNQVPGGFGGYAITTSNWYDEILSGTLVVPSDDESTLTHEFSHILGLAHPFDTSYGTTTLPDIAGTYDTGPLGFNSIHYTVMAYATGVFAEFPTENIALPASLMALDIAALQAMYGANDSYRTGDDSYGIINRTEAIWDAGGEDAIDFSAATTDAVIDLRAATLEVAEGGLGRASTTDLTAGYWDPAPGAYVIAYGVIIEGGFGGSGNDTITGNDAGNTLRGNAGNDSLLGLDGTDALFGGDGQDTLRGGLFADTLFGGNGDDRVWGGMGRDDVYLGDGNDVFNDDAQDGLLGGDHVVAGAGRDTINGGGGDDLFSGLAGADLISGGIGDDTIYGGTEYDTLHGGDGNDRVWGGNGRDLISLGAGDDVFYDNAQGGDLGRDTVFSGAGNDTIQGGNGGDVFHGVGGNDLIFARLGDDLLFGGDGFDTLDAGDGNDTVTGGNGRDVVFMGRGDDRFNDNSQGGDLGRDAVWAGAGNDTIQGGNGNDTFRGEIGDDLLFGRLGDDRMEGGTGNDTQSGGDGADTFVFAAGFGTDLITDYSKGEDRLEFDDALWAGVVTGVLTAAQVVSQFAQDTGPDVVFDFGGGDSVTLLGVAALDGIAADLILV